VRLVVPPLEARVVAQDFIQITPLVELQDKVIKVEQRKVIQVQPHNVAVVEVQALLD
jgi:hypothetical protein